MYYLCVYECVRVCLFSCCFQTQTRGHQLADRRNKKRRGMMMMMMERGKKGEKKRDRGRGRVGKRGIGKRKKTEEEGGKVKERRKKGRLAGDMKAELRADLPAFLYRHNSSASVCFTLTSSSFGPSDFHFYWQMYRTGLEGIPF